MPAIGAMITAFVEKFRRCFHISFYMENPGCFRPQSSAQIRG